MLIVLMAFLPPHASLVLSHSHLQALSAASVVLLMDSEYLDRQVNDFQVQGNIFGLLVPKQVDIKHLICLLVLHITFILTLNCHS